MEPTKPVKLVDAVKEALAKKHQADHPDARKSKTKQSGTSKGVPVITGRPMKKASGRGG